MQVFRVRSGGKFITANSGKSMWQRRHYADKLASELRTPAEVVVFDLIEVSSESTTDAPRATIYGPDWDAIKFCNN